MIHNFTNSVNANANHVKGLYTYIPTVYGVLHTVSCLGLFMPFDSALSRGHLQFSLCLAPKKPPMLRSNISSCIWSIFNNVLSFKLFLDVPEHFLVSYHGWLCIAAKIKTWYSSWGELELLLLFPEGDKLYPLPYSGGASSQFYEVNAVKNV